MKPLYIFDLDGTLALIAHRRPLIEPPNKDWDGFYKACVHDLPNLPVIEIMESLRKTAEIWVFSGRSDIVRTETVEWLVRCTGFEAKDFEDNPALLMMRKAGDYTPDAVLKKRWLEGMLKTDRERLVAVFEDRDRMVQMWRQEGLTCLQVAPGEF